MSDPTGTRGGSDEGPSEAELRLLGALGRALGADPPPAGFLGRADRLVEVLDLDHDLAELFSAEAPELAGARGGADVLDPLVFELADGSVTVEVTMGADAAGVRVTGVVSTDADADGDALRLDLETTTAVVATGRVDAIGRFELTVDDIDPTGPVRLRVRVPDRRPVTTDWFLLRPRST